ncbi:GNAT family N-acetyltransferase [Actinoplanes sp. NPDC048796]|uniref:GNAT family N-acetyltransferase n=1 Tax=Actinoplanes sp. NPDC048796 TaxID=3155640 RepID=UPI0033EA575C
MPEPVTLRAVRPTDLDTFFAHQQEPQAVRRANFPARDRDTFHTHWTERILADEAVTARTVLSGERIAGNVVSWWQDGRREVGYWLGQEFWGRSIGTGALRLYLEIETTRPLYGTTDVGNLASRRVLERCGFVHVETAENDGRRYDLLVLA